MRIARAAAEIDPVSATARSKSAFPGPIAISEPERMRTRTFGVLSRKRCGVMAIVRCGQRQSYHGGRRRDALRALQRQGERTAASRRALDRQIAAHRASEVAADGETEPGT